MSLRMALFTLGMAACGYAQSYVADIPFRFHIGDRSYASGRYYFSQRVSIADPQMVWTMRSNETQRAIIFPTTTGRTPTPAPDSRLVFRKYGATCFLSEIMGEGRPSRELPASRSERNLTKDAHGAEVVKLSAVR